ncbi:MAG TPA: hypothetical protein V6C58_17250 [Allocoleopsis sp.]
MPVNLIFTDPPKINGNLIFGEESGAIQLYTDANLQINNSSSDQVYIYIDLTVSNVNQESTTSTGNISLQLNSINCNQDNSSDSIIIDQIHVLTQNNSNQSNSSSSVEIQQILFVFASNSISTTASTYTPVPGGTVKPKAPVVNNRELRLRATVPRTITSDITLFSNDGAQFKIDVQFVIGPSSIGLDSTETVLPDPTYGWEYKSNEDQIWKPVVGAISPNQNLMPEDFDIHRGEGKEVVYRINTAQITFLPGESSFKVVLNDDDTISAMVFKPVEVPNSTLNILSTNIPADCATGTVKWMQIPYKGTYVAVPYLLKNNV